MKSRIIVYFIQAGQHGPIKIGHTSSQKTLSLRMGQLQSASPYRLKLLGCIGTNDSLLENKLHQQFAFCHLQGEWFRHDPLISEYIKTHRAKFPFEIAADKRHKNMKFLTCSNCGYQWKSRKISPQECPACKSRNWK